MNANIPNDYTPSNIPTTDHGDEEAAQTPQDAERKLRDATAAPHEEARTGEPEATETAQGRCALVRVGDEVEACYANCNWLEGVVEYVSPEGCLVRAHDPSEMDKEDRPSFFTAWENVKVQAGGPADGAEPDAPHPIGLLIRPGMHVEGRYGNDAVTGRVVETTRDGCLIAPHSPTDIEREDLPTFFSKWEDVMVSAIGEAQPTEAEADAEQDEQPADLTAYHLTFKVGDVVHAMDQEGHGYDATILQMTPRGCLVESEDRDEDRPVYFSPWCDVRPHEGCKAEPSPERARALQRLLADINEAHGLADLAAEQTGHRAEIGEDGGVLVRPGMKVSAECGGNWAMGIVESVSDHGCFVRSLEDAGGAGGIREGEVFGSAWYQVDVKPAGPDYSTGNPVPAPQNATAEPIAKVSTADPEPEEDRSDWRRWKDVPGAHDADPFLALADALLPMIGMAERLPESPDVVVARWTFSMPGALSKIRHQLVDASSSLRHDRAINADSYADWKLSPDADSAIQSHMPAIDDATTPAPAENAGDDQAIVRAMGKVADAIAAVTALDTGDDELNQAINKAADYIHQGHGDLSAMLCGYQTTARA